MLHRLALALLLLWAAMGSATAYPRYYRHHYHHHHHRHHHRYYYHHGRRYRRY